MALRATVARLATSQGLSAPAGAPVFSASLPEARAKARQFFREVRTRVTRLATGRAPDRLAPDADARVALTPRLPTGFVRFFCFVRFRSAPARASVDPHACPNAFSNDCSSRARPRSRTTRARFRFSVTNDRDAYMNSKLY
jgi:hypothetical protein